MDDADVPETVSVSKSSPKTRSTHATTENTWTDGHEGSHEDGHKGGHEGSHEVGFWLTYQHSDTERIEL